MTHDEIVAYLTARLGETFTHNKTHKRYDLIDLCEVKQVDGTWYAAAIYRPLLHTKLYARDVADFYETFSSEVGDE